MHISPACLRLNCNAEFKEYLSRRQNAKRQTETRIITNGAQVFRIDHLHFRGMFRMARALRGKPLVSVNPASSGATTIAPGAG
jgi:hypothetical protein